MEEILIISKSLFLKCTTGYFKSKLREFRSKGKFEP